MRKHVSHSVWWIVWLQINSFRESVIFPPFLFLSSPLFWSHRFLSPCDTKQPSMHGRWELRKACLWSERKEPFLNLFLWIDSYPPPFYPASEYWINQSAILEEETAFPVRWEEEGEALKAFWKKKKTVFSYCRCHHRCLSAVVKASRLSPWIFWVPVSLPKCVPCLVMRVSTLVSCPPSGLNIFERGVEQASFCYHFYSSYAMTEDFFFFF